MSEMKVYHCDEWHNTYTEFYLKSKADKVIARHNHARNALERTLNKSKDSRKRCHNHLNKGYNYKFIPGRCLRRVK